MKVVLATCQLVVFKVRRGYHGPFRLFSMLPGASKPVIEQIRQDKLSAATRSKRETQVIT